jgi:hypothetical protein
MGPGQALFLFLCHDQSKTGRVGGRFAAQLPIDGAPRLHGATDYILHDFDSVLFMC